MLLSRIQLVAISLLLTINSFCSSSKTFFKVRDVFIHDSEFAVDTILEDGQHILFPYFDKEYTTIAPELKTLLIKQTHELLDYIERVVTKEFEHLGSIRVYNTLKVSEKLFAMERSAKAARHRLNKPFPKEVEFHRAMRTMFAYLLSRSKKANETLPKETLEQSKINFHNYIEALKGAFKASPTGCYIDFSKGSINESTFMRQTIKVMVSLRRNGLASLLNTLTNLINFMFKSELSIVCCWKGR